MRSKLATAALAGALGITGVAGAVFVAPALYLRFGANAERRLNAAQ